MVIVKCSSNFLLPVSVWMKIVQSFVSIVKSHKVISVLIGLTVLSSIILPVVLLKPVYDEVILIESDDDFLKYDYILGNGTFDAPYIIESRNIVNETSRYGIYIDNTTAFFIIRDCMIDVYSGGIYLKDNAPHTAIIEDNEITVASYGAIHLAYTSGVLIRNNILRDCFWGLLVYNSEFIDVHDNKFKNTTVEINYSDSCTFKNNLIQDYRRVVFSTIYNISIDNNRFYGGTGTIDLNYITDLSLTNNEIEFRGITLYSPEITDFNNYVVVNNSVAGFPYGFFINQNNLTIENRYGQFLFYNCSSILTKDQNFVSISETIRIYSCESLSFQNIEIISGEIYSYNSPFSSFNNITIERGRLKLVNCLNSSVVHSYVSNYAAACVEMINCPDSKFENNVVVNSTNEYAFCPKCRVSHGTYFTNSHRTSLVNNSFINSGLAIDIGELNTYMINNNTVDGALLELLKDVTNTILSEKYGQLFLINCVNITITNQEMTAPVIALTFWKCSNILIYENEFNRYNSAICQRQSAISIISSNNLTVVDCLFQYRSNIASVRSSSNVSLISNVIENSNSGFDFWESISCKIVNNNMLNCERACRVHDCNDTIIHSNNFVNLTSGGYRSYMCYNLTISFNTFEAIGDNFDEGILLENVFNSSVVGNYIFSAENGIVIGGSSWNIISNNTIQSSISYGMSIYSDSHFNQIYFNNFIQNNLEGSSQAYDENNDNSWYSVANQIGNYWDDLGTDLVYTIAGIAGKEDIYPASAPF